MLILVWTMPMSFQMMRGSSLKQNCNHNSNHNHNHNHSAASYKIHDIWSHQKNNIEQSLDESKTS
jgi:hypothetical protein